MSMTRRVWSTLGGAFFKTSSICALVMSIAALGCANPMVENMSSAAAPKTALYIVLSLPDGVACFAKVARSIIISLESWSTHECMRHGYNAYCPFLQKHEATNDVDAARRGCGDRTWFSLGCCD